MHEPAIHPLVAAEDAPRPERTERDFYSEDDDTMKRELLAGQKFGRLSVTADLPSMRSPCGQMKSYVRALCDCGTQIEVLAMSLKHGNTSSCGCLSREKSAAINRTHGASKTVRYRIYRDMLKRCYDTSNHAYANYGGRGIRVCDRWHDFASYLSDTGERPPGMSLDRIDNNGNYEPGNVRWANAALQARNRRSTILITIGEKTQCLLDWCNELGVCYEATQRLIRHKGMAPIDALSLLHPF